MAKTGQIQLEQITLDASPSTLAAARELLLEYGRFVIAQPGAARFCFGSLEKEAERLPASYIEQQGGCLLARVKGEPAGFIAWRALAASVSPDAWELKRLWVRPSGRGLGLGHALMQSALDQLSAAGCKSVFLDTVPQAMAAAVRIYLELGFQPCEPYNDNPVEGIDYFVKHL